MTHDINFVFNNMGGGSHMTSSPNYVVDESLVCSGVDLTSGFDVDEWYVSLQWMVCMQSFI